MNLKTHCSPCNTSPSLPTPAYSSSSIKNCSLIYILFKLWGEFFLEHNNPWCWFCERAVDI